MATGVTASTYQTVLGIAPEPQPATGTPVDPTNFIPVTSLDPKNTVAKLLDQSWRGSMVQTTGVQNGPQSSELSVAGNAYPDTIGFFLTAALGDLVTTGAGAPFTHTIALENGGNGQPQSYTLTDSDPLSTRQYASSRLTELTLTYDAAELLKYESSWLGWSGALDGTAPTPSYSAIPPAPSWQCAITLGGAANATVKTMEVTFSREDSECIYTLQNNPNPYEVHVGPIVVNFKGTMVAATEQPLLDYLTNTSQALVMNLASGAGAAATQLQITSTQANYQTVTKSRSNSWIEFEVEALAVGNTTDAGASAGYSPCKVVLQNALPANTYVPAP